MPDLPQAAAAFSYRGRLAPSPTGWLHIGHARTFWTAYQRCLAARGRLVLRNEDLDASRARPEYEQAMIEDLRWLGIRWDEGPDCVGASGPYAQSQREHRHRLAFERLRRDGWVYPCRCTRKDIQAAVAAPHPGDEEAIYPGFCRGLRIEEIGDVAPAWRFRVPEAQAVSFVDGGFGPQSFVAGRDFGDFVVWRKDDHPAYQLAVVVDDAEMGITEVVRGADLLLSTARQLLIYRALGLEPPAFYHCPLVLDDQGRRLAKRHDSLSIRTLRTAGRSPESIRG
ncbi:MAG: tRNA glutamyl-Q(34) synthetase GluQRS [Verrucomicrobia bacterium]|nr:tRNA glutamyl-Q(34) synthetase GluQRS [Verrucomicrobiota bacterium]